jgi:penicillin amidase
MRWHALEVDDQTATIFRGVNLSSSVEEAITASALPSAVAQHLLLADADGHIGLAQLGSLVNRRGFTGRLPYPGSDPSYGWDGWLEERYIEIDPDKGYLHTANSRIGYPNSERISTSYLPNSRYNRITELLESQSTFTPHDLATQQLDVQDFTAKTRLPLFLATVSPSSPAAQQCYDILIDWQYTWTKDSTAATVWAVFQRELLRQALVDDIGETGFQTYLQVVGSSRSLIAYGIEDFLQDPEKSTNLALEQTCLALQKSAGDDTKNWTWGAHHPLKLEHPFARDKKILSKWNMPTRPFGGSGSTIAAAGHGWTVENTQVGGMASMRMIMTPGGDTPARIVYPGGQSGQPGHKDYKNLFETYVNGQTVPLWFGRADVERETQHQLILQPVSAAPR